MPSYKTKAKKLFCFTRQSLDLSEVFPSGPNVVHIILLPAPQCTLNTSLKEITLSPHSLSYFHMLLCFRKNANVFLKVILFGCKLHKQSKHKVGFATKWLLESQNYDEAT